MLLFQHNPRRARDVHPRSDAGERLQRFCGTEASSHTQTFVHIEQDPTFRNPADWVAAIRATFT